MVVQLRRELNVLLDKESKMWRQRARTQWVAKGDKNTRYFQKVATQRKRNFFIKGINDGEGVWQRDDEVVSATFVEFYTRLFTQSHSHDLDRVLEGVKRIVTADMNVELVKPYCMKEVDIAIKQMAPLKAPRPNGMPPFFYQSFWQHIGLEVTEAVLSCLNSGTLLKSINHTFINLIPKVSNLENVSKFRPISLCNVIYKIISKVIANRLKPFLNSIVSEAQSAFIANRLITDNILIVFESLHYMKTQSSGREGFMTLKLDMSKAYDRVEWSFLEKIMLKMGFQDSWVAMIMQCVSTVTYSILLNGEPKGFIEPSKGLRQGDPLSPFLFLFCVEGLNALLNKAVDNGEIRGLSLCRQGPKITHLFFADDCLLFCKAKKKECQIIHQLLHWYNSASGQLVNKDKTTLFFSRNTPEEVQQEIKVLLGVSTIKHYEKYLGLLSFVGRQKKACFIQIKERIWTKMQGWKAKLLSQAGKEVMIKEVIQSIPTYSMSVFRLPIGLIKDIETMIRKFGRETKIIQEECSG